MGQAIQQFRRAMSLRSDPGRLSLETGLTGTALWLTFLYLMQDGAMAAAAEGGASPEYGPGAGAAAGQGTALTAGPAGGGGAEGGAPAGGEPGSASTGGARPGLGPADPPSPVGGGDRGIRLPDQMVAGALPNAWAQEGPLSGSRSEAAASSGLPWTSSPGAPRGQKRSHASEPIDATSNAPSNAPSAGPGAGPERPAMASPEAPPEIPTLRVVVRSDDSLVSRSVEGEAHSRYRHSLDAIRDAVIDLRDIRTPRVQVGSDRELTLLAHSVLDDADLSLESHTTGMNRATLLLGPEANDIRLRVSDAIDLGLRAGGLARGQILQSLIGMLDSRLEDAGGGGTLELSSLARFLLQSPVGAANRQIGIDLLAQAMQDSAILLGDGDDRVLIASGFQDPQDGVPGLRITLPPAAGPTDADASVQLRARALGLVNSRLEVGGGDDVVRIRTWLDPTWPAVAERIALLDSDVDLGEGDDRLSVEGAVTGSRIAAGPGANRLDFDGPVNASTLALAPGSANAVDLGAWNDTLVLHLAGDAPAQLTLAAAGGDDRIDAPLARLTGSIDGGAGFDTLVEAPGPDGVFRGEGLVTVHLEGPGSGTVGALDFSGWENLSLGDGDALVTVGATGRLDGRLEAGGGLDGLDYGAWREPVVVDLGRGKASGILGGISGFETVRTGAGDDRFELDLGALEDRAGAGVPPLVFSGGEGRDRFVLAGMEAIRMRAQANDRALPVLADLEWSPGGGIGLTDAIAWRLGGLLADRAGDQAPVDLTPAGLEGIGQPRLLPIAPLDQLVSGMGARPAGMDQLAIATGDLGSRLVLLGSDRSVTAIAELPALRSPEAGSAAGAWPGPAAAA
jgi:hypothetical protein